MGLIGINASTGKATNALLKRRIFEIAVLAIFVIAIAVQAFGRRPIGLADNGDFPKVLGRLNAWPVPEHDTGTFKYFVPDYVIDPSHHWDSGIPTVELVFARVSKGIGSAFLPATHFDLRFLGVVHGLILAIAVWLILRALRNLAWPASVGLAILTILILADVEYSEFLNTAYMDAASIYLSVLLFALTLNFVGTKRTVNWKEIIAFGICGALFLATKVQHEPCLLALTLFCSFFAARSNTPKVLIASIVSIALMIGASIFMIVKMPPDYEAESRFSLVFLKLLPLSNSPQEALEELGRPSSDIRYIGMHAWAANSPLAENSYRNQFWHDVSEKKIARFYLNHPGMIRKIIWGDLLTAGKDVPVSEVPVGLSPRIETFYGAYRKSDNPRPYSRAEGLRVWSAMRRSAASGLPLAVPILYLAVFVTATYKLSVSRRSTNVGRWPLILMMAAIGILSYLVGSLADATDTSRHIVIYQVSTDLILLCLAYELAQLRSNQARRG